MKNFEKSPICEQFFEKFPTQFSDEPLHGKVKFSPDTFEIPAFVSFDENDAMIDYYKKERERIQKIYKGNDFLNLTLQKLLN